MKNKIPDWKETKNCYYCEHMESVEEKKRVKNRITISYRYKCNAHKVEITEIGYCGKFKRSEDENT